MGDRTRSDPVQRSNWRAWWMRQLRAWHWISAAICLVTTLLFAVTGITLNHAGQIEGRPVTATRTQTVPEAVRLVLGAHRPAGRGDLPQPVTSWLVDAFGVQTADREAEWGDTEVYVALKRPGGDGWISIDRKSGEATFETTDRGWVSYLNDLHKGRNVGPVWSWFIDVFAVGCVVFCITGLLLLQIYAKGRRSTWPVVGFGLALPMILAALFAH